MSVEGLCQICQTETIDEDCQRCGQLVCSTHYDESTGYCTQCVAEMGGTPSGDDQPDDPDYPDGVDEHQF